MITLISIFVKTSRKICTDTWVKKNLVLQDKEINNLIEKDMVLQDKEINNLIEKDIVQHIREYSIYF
jgi:hypothetical protein